MFKLTALVLLVLSLLICGCASHPLMVGCKQVGQVNDAPVFAECRKL